MSTYLTAFAIVDFGSVVTQTAIENTPAELFARTSQIGNLGQSMDGVGVDNLMWLGAKCTERTTDQFGDVLRYGLTPWFPLTLISMI